MGWIQQIISEFLRRDDRFVGIGNPHRELERDFTEAGVEGPLGRSLPALHHAASHATTSYVFPSRAKCIAGRLRMLAPILHRLARGRVGLHRIELNERRAELAAKAFDDDEESFEQPSSGAPAARQNRVAN